MAIHNDLTLAFLAPLYFIYDGPETLLVIQSLILALGALAMYGITRHVFEKQHYSKMLGLVMSFAYLMYFPMQRANIFDFHSVTFATTFLLFMFLYWLKKQYRLSIVFLILALLTKEQIGLTTTFFGMYAVYAIIQSQKLNVKSQKSAIKNKGDVKRDIMFAVGVIGISVFWFLVSMLVIIPYFRGGNHFALEYYANLQEIPRYIFHRETVNYLTFLLGPLAYISLLSPLHLLIAIPEFGINLLSNNWNMRNIIYHYTSVIQPFVFISAVYGIRRLLGAGSMVLAKKTVHKNRPVVLMMFLLAATVLFAFIKGPLPLSREADLYAFTHKPSYLSEIWRLRRSLGDDVKVSATGHIGPVLASRRYMYVFRENYTVADYVIVSVDEALKGWKKEITNPAYRMLQKDPDYVLIQKSGDLEVYKKFIH